MAIFTVIAIYFILFFLCLFLVLPFGVRTTDEVGGERVPGQADSAPHEFSVWRTAAKTAVVAAIPTAFVYLNYQYDWIDRDSFHGLMHWLGAPPLN